MNILLISVSLDKFSGENMVSKWLGVEIKEKDPTEKYYVFEIRPN